MKLKWAKYCVFSATGNDNLYNIVNYNNGNNIILTIKDTKLYVPVVTLSAIDNQKLSNVPSEGCERYFIGMNIKQKVRLNYDKWVKIFYRIKFCLSQQNIWFSSFE